MKRRLLDLLRCPSCQAPLKLDQTSVDGAEILEGKLRCASCSRQFPITGGVPRFVAPNNYADNFGFQWNEFRLTQLDSHSGVPISRGRFCDETGWDQSMLRGALVLDAGCGAGRFAEVALEMGAEVVGVDFSSAVDAAGRNLSRYDRFHVLQANIYELPLAAEAFDFVYSLGVLQHTPDVRRALLSLPRFVKPGGRLTVDIYPRGWQTFLHAKYWLRPITRRMSPARLFGIIRRAAPRLLVISRAVGRLPLFGRALQRLIPVANYGGVYPLSESQVVEWAVLDTFDWLSPEYDQPQTARTLTKWLAESGLTETQVTVIHHLTGRGRKPGREKHS